MAGSAQRTYARELQSLSRLRITDSLPLNMRLTMSYNRMEGAVEDNGFKLLFNVIES